MDGINKKSSDEDEKIVKAAKSKSIKKGSTTKPKSIIDVQKALLKLPRRSPRLCSYQCFIKEYRTRHTGIPASKQVSGGAAIWNNLSQEQKDMFKPENMQNNDYSKIFEDKDKTEQENTEKLNNSETIRTIT